MRIKRIYTILISVLGLAMMFIILAIIRTNESLEMLGMTGLVFILGILAFVINEFRDDQDNV